MANDKENNGKNDNANDKDKNQNAIDHANERANLVSKSDPVFTVAPAVEYTEAKSATIEAIAFVEPSLSYEPQDNSVSENDITELEASVAVSDKAYAKIAKLGFDPDEIKAVFGLDTPEVRAAWLNGFKARGKKPDDEKPNNGKSKRTIGIAAP